ncbi:MAG: hypothetical protein ACKVP3_08550 [Hyphomicrobiaceae bacterium]
MTRSQPDTLEAAARAAMVAEDYGPLARKAQQSKGSMALPMFAGALAIIAFAAGL